MVRFTEKETLVTDTVGCADKDCLIGQIFEAGKSGKALERAKQLQPRKEITFDSFIGTRDVDYTMISCHRNGDCGSCVIKEIKH